MDYQKEIEKHFRISDKYGDLALKNEEMYDAYWKLSVYHLKKALEIMKEVYDKKTKSRS